MARTRSETTDQAIVAEARALLIEVGTAGFTIEEVARRCGVSKATVYRRWPDRAALLRSAIESAIPAVPDAVSSGDLLVDLRRIVRGFLDSAAGSDDLRTLLLGMTLDAMSDPVVAELRRGFIVERDQPILGILRAAIERGELPDDLDFEVALDLVIGPLAARRFLRGDSMSDDHIGRLLDAIVPSLQHARRARAVHT